MSRASELRLVLVTPETTLLDEPVGALRFPLYDGQIGVLPGRAPLLGRLGYGELKLRTAGREASFFVDGGFVQIKGPVVTILTHRALPVDQIDRSEAERQLQDASARVPTSEADFAAKARDQERARRMLRLARGGR